MSTTQKEPNFVSLDVDQWRRDIQTFADTTRQALDAIVSELSNQCSGNPAPIRTSSSRDSLAARTSSTKSGIPSRKATKPPVSVAKPTRGSESSKPSKPAKSPDDRLSKLKNQLAERLAKK